MTAPISTKFVIVGDPCGYYAQGSRRPRRGSSGWKRAQKYHAWCDYVRQVATVACVPLPLEATQEAPLVITTRAYFRNRVHPDPENVHKGLVDALFYGNPAGDKYVSGQFEPPMYDAKQPRVVVEIRKAD